MMLIPLSESEEIRVLSEGEVVIWAFVERGGQLARLRTSLQKTTLLNRGLHQGVGPILMDDLATAYTHMREDL